MPEWTKACDGITCLDGVIILAMGMEDWKSPVGNRNNYGKDGAVRFAWCTTLNNNWDYDSPIVPQMLVQFGELKDGKITDITKYIWFKKQMPR